MTRLSRAAVLVPGTALALALALAAMRVSAWHPALDPLVVGILLGILVRALIGGAPIVDPGVSAASGFCITVGILFYGASLNFTKLTAVPLTTWLQIAIGIILVFWIALWLERRLQLTRPLICLLAVGTAICGASAIAMTTPVVKAKAEEAGAALVTITIWGLTGALLYPLVMELLMMSTDNYALLCATTLHQTGLVKAAAGQAGADCLQDAMTIKVARTAMIIPLLLIASCLSLGAQTRPRLAVVPWYLWAFVAVGVLFALVPRLAQTADSVKPVGQFLWTIAMCGLGLSVKRRSLLAGLGRPLAAGLILWLVLCANFFIGYYGLNY